jgi:DNA-binding PadR family transcriptional regulator
MSLRYAILGFLSSTPATGYDIARDFDQAAGSFWHALRSQIYGELKSLEEAGLIRGKIARGDRLRRRVFSLTPAGEAELQGWVEKPNDYPGERDAERIKLMFLDGAPWPVIRRHLQDHAAHHRARFATWKLQHDATGDRTHRQLAGRLSQRPAAEHAKIVFLKQLATEGNMRRAQLEIDWAEDAIARIDAIEASERLPPQRRSAG